MTAALISECLLDVSDEDVSNIGIYVIVSESGKFYVGQSSNLKRREYEHFRTLRNNTHGNKHLQRSFNKYGYLDFYVIEYHYDPWQLTAREDYWIKFLDSYAEGMNQTPAAATSLGCIRTEEQRRVISEITKEFWGKEENRKAQSERRKNFFRNNPDALLKMSETTKKILRDNPERCEKHSALMTEKSSTAEYVETFTKRMANWRSTISTEEAREMGLKTVATKRSLGEEYNKRSLLRSSRTKVINMCIGDSHLQWQTTKSRSGRVLTSCCVRWTEVNGEQKLKRFSALKYGVLPAHQMALLYREHLQIRLLSEYDILLN